MKKPFSIFFVLLILSCKNKKQQTHLLDCDNDKIFECWKMCSYQCNGQMLEFNVCKDFLFLEDGTGNIGFDEPFIWKLKKGKLVIYNFSVTQNSLSNDTLFTTFFTNNYHNLTLESKSGCAYYLNVSK